ncbi:site-specific DNA-methyltransferase [Mycoplasma mycoides]|nr:hypothetical protein I7640_00460 [Mycoplasma mycoides subsp. capri]QVK08609.1 hypothetical protein I7644_00465 [Mycoplasma mycoides subsp. capri]
MVKEIFFREVRDTLVCDKQEFSRFIYSKKFLKDSYTIYINKITLTSRIR